jgi:hypothetical protein
MANYDKSYEIRQNTEKFGQNAGIFSEWIADGILLHPRLGAKLGLIQRMMTWHTAGNVKSSMAPRNGSGASAASDGRMVFIIFLYTKIKKCMDSIEDKKFAPYVKKWCVEMSDDPVEFMHAQNSTVRNQMIKSLNDALTDILKYIDDTENKPTPKADLLPESGSEPESIKTIDEIILYMGRHSKNYETFVRKMKVQCVFNRRLAIEIDYVGNENIKALGTSYFYRSREIKLSPDDSCRALDCLTEIINKNNKPTKRKENDNHHL